MAEFPCTHRSPGPGAGGLAIIVMGVSGCGKSTLGQRIADGLGCAFLEGDSFHSVASVARMRAGHPLDDADRWPWLDRIGAALNAAVAADGRAVASCSALKHSYRLRLATAAGGRTAFVLLATDRDELARRMRARSGHYMPATLLDSQIATLEPPVAGECALVLDAAQPPDVLRDRAIEWIANRP